MKLTTFIFVLPLLFSVSVSAVTPVSGDLSKYNLTPDGNPFVVLEDITVPTGKNVTIPGGCIFLFKPFTGLTIEGGLIVKGTAENRVTFSTENDTRFMPQSQSEPNPFDWNGIAISRHASKVELSYFELSYSVYGLKSQKENVYIQNGIFNRNGQFHFTINDKIQFVQESLPFFYGVSQDAPQNDSQKKRTKDPAATAALYRKSAVVALAGCGAAALGFGGYYTFDAFDKDRTAREKVNSLTNSQINYLVTQRDQSVVKSVLSLSVAALCIPSAFYIYRFSSKQKAAVVSFGGHLDLSGGSLTLDFDF